MTADGDSVTHLGVADCFGEIAGLTGSRRTTTVRAEIRLDLLRVRQLLASALSIPSTPRSPRFSQRTAAVKDSLTSATCA